MPGRGEAVRRLPFPKDWKILALWRLARKRGTKKSRRFSRKKKYLRTGI